MPGATWRCGECDTYNGVEVDVCDICAARRPPEPAPPPPSPAEPERFEPESFEPVPFEPVPVWTAPVEAAPDARDFEPGPSPAWICELCGTHNGLGEHTCVRCGAPDDLRFAPDDLFARAPTPPAPRRAYDRRPPERSQWWGCLVALLLVAGFVMGGALTLDLFGNEDGQGGDGEPPSGASATPSGPCPDAVAERLADPERARLVASYGVVSGSVVLCRDADGALWYVETPDGGEPGMPLAARETEFGFVADDPPTTRYEIRDDVLVVIEDGETVGEVPLTPEAPTG
ncbi:zinc finger protein [Streptomyces radicis]|uniref:RanBP2-type domain-containing protein n=1 Tax=Streptomyces radicis TaxID=1750517 RepID=A0A3A9WBI7_9ACTN|nr:zinc finger protein [Streptomyces radicis]RKN10109.1 hypothetical protein D7319_10095 [Streptomyces radicis]RKN24451.1 hypothetical protein D7318_11275 [Streptomyces radicis]